MELGTEAGNEESNTTSTVISIFSGKLYKSTKKEDRPVTLIPDVAEYVKASVSGYTQHLFDLASLSLEGGSPNRNQIPNPLI
jgi:hypothetical protein